MKSALIFAALVSEATLVDPAVLVDAVLLGLLMAFIKLGENVLDETVVMMVILFLN